MDSLSLKINPSENTSEEQTGQVYIPLQRCGTSILSIISLVGAMRRCARLCHLAVLSVLWGLIDRRSVNNTSGFLGWDLTSCLEITPSWEITNYAVTQEYPVLWNLKIHYRVQKNTPLAPILTQINQVNTTPFCLFKIHFIIIYPPTFCLPSRLSSCGCLGLAWMESSPQNEHFLAHSSREIFCIHWCYMYVVFSCIKSTWAFFTAK
jgi:hypothetical protein